MNRRTPVILHYYIAKEFILSFAISFMFFFVIFFINQLLLMAEEILSKNAPLLDVILLVVYALPAIVAMSFPFASLVGSIMAISRFVVDNEFLVMRASGISRFAVFIPFLVLGMVFSVISFIANDYFLPLGTMNYSKTYRRLITTAPALELKPYSVKSYQGTVIVTGAIDGTIISDLVIIDKTRDNKSRVITAGTASLSDHADSQGVITLTLVDVFTQESSLNNPDKYEYSSADGMEYNILLSRFTDVSTTLGPHEMRSIDVRKIIQEKQSLLDAKLLSQAREISLAYNNLAMTYTTAVTTRDARLDNSAGMLQPFFSEYNKQVMRKISDRSLYLYKMEYYKKFSIPFGALCFIFLSFPLSVSIRKSNRGAGFAIGLLVAVLYWAMLFGGQNLGLRTGFPAFWAMWLPNILVVGSGLILAIVNRER
ncbi:MAG: LptF/LptG family permease [Spirochaetes bacterium]|nr:LptF/LptG family permease [Spirochaetota bacterium]